MGMVFGPSPFFVFTTARMKNHIVRTLEWPGPSPFLTLATAPNEERGHSLERSVPWAYLKCFSYHAIERSIMSTVCLGSRRPWPSRG
jgi:hypothetical protein